MCGYPECKNPAEIRQHTRRFKLFPNHDPDFIVPLCKKHDQLAHLGLIENEEKQPVNPETGAKNWKIQIYADKNAPKYKVDRIVNKFRQPTG